MRQGNACRFLKVGGGMITVDEVKKYSRIDIDDDDGLLQDFVTAAVEYLKNATGKEYPETNENGKKINYELEKIYLKLLVSYWYDHRTPVLTRASKFEVGEEFSFMTRSIMLQLQNK